MQWRKFNATALRKCHILEPPLNEAFMPNKSGIVSDLQFVDTCTNSVLLYFQSKREIIFKYTHKEMKNPFFLITKYFNLLNDKLSTRIRLNTNRCLGVLKVLKEMIEFAILISWYQISLSGISKFSKANGRYPNNKPFVNYYKKRDFARIELAKHRLKILA